MTQTERRPGSPRKQTSIGSIATIVLLLIVFFARNYFTPTNEVTPIEIPANGAQTVDSPADNTLQTTQEDQATKENIAIQAASEGEASVTIESNADAEANANIEAGKDVQKSEPPLLSSAGTSLEKKATRTPTPKPRNTSKPTRTPKATLTASATNSDTAKATATVKKSATSTATAKRAPPTATATPRAAKSQSGLPIVYFEDLPREAQQTIRLIDKGGPFPYSRDGIEFQNRERILPRKSRGYYSEYTVITPGSNDRGARRIIAGENGELYYTDDHYDSFKEVVR